jgi:hypothetical protein
MDSKAILRTALLDQFTSFVKELSEMYPNDPDFSMFLMTINLLKQTNPIMIVKYIHDNTNIYYEQIMNKDKSFFIDHTFDEYKQYLKMDIFTKMKEYFNTMSDESKENVWLYSQNIVRLAKACYS